MAKITMAAPFHTRGRYQGGISALVNAVMRHDGMSELFGADVVPFETCRMDRHGSPAAAVNLTNIRNFIKIYVDLPRELEAAGSTCLYYHSAAGLALLKDLLAMRKVKRKMGVSTVLHIHYADYEKIMTGNAAVDALILRLMRKYVDYVVFLSRKTMKEFVAHGIPEARSRVIYNFSTITYSRDEIDDHLSRPAQKRQFLFVGSIDDRKGIFDALSCMADLEEDFTLHVCGDFGNEADRRRFESYAAHLGDKLVYHGYVVGEEKRRRFLEADVLLLPSIGEGFPVVIPEAFSAACGIVTTDVGAIPEVVGEENGCVVAPSDQTALREAIVSYIEMDAATLAEQKEHNYLLSGAYTITHFIEALGSVCREAGADGANKTDCDC